MRPPDNSLMPAANINSTNFSDLTRQEMEMIYAWRTDPSIAKWMVNQDPIQWEDHIRFCQGLRGREDRIYWLIKEGETPIGVFSYSNILKAHSHAELGIYARPDGKIPGAGSKIISKGLSLGFEIMELNTIYLHVFDGNDKAVRLYEKFGFKHIGTLKQHFFIQGRFIDALLLQLTKTGWTAATGI